MFRSSQPSDLNFFQAIQQQVLGFPVLLLNANATCWASSLCLCLKQGTDKRVTVRLTDIVVWNKQRWKSKIFTNGFLQDITSKPKCCSNMTILGQEKSGNSRHDYDVNNVQDDFQSNMGQRLSNGSMEPFTDYGHLENCH